MSRMLIPLLAGTAAALLTALSCWWLMRSRPGRIAICATRLCLIAIGVLAIVSFLWLYQPAAWIRVGAEMIGDLLSDGILLAVAGGVGAVLAATCFFRPPEEERRGNRMILMAGGIGVASLLSACVVLPTTSDAAKEVPDLENDPDVLVALVESNQITFRPDGGALAPVCICGPKVTFYQIAESAREAIVAVEDARYWDHRGIDPVGLVRAGLRTVLSAFTRVEGGSTITEQVVKNMVLDSRRNLGRKMREKALAVDLEAAMSKTEILAAYLNGISFGHVEGRPIVGIEAASRYYFGRTAEDLSLLESAILAGMVRAPSALNYRTEPEAAMARAEVVLKAMVERDFITEAQAEQALASERPRGEAGPIGFEPRSFIAWVLENVRASHPDLEFDTSTRIPITLQVVTQSRAERAYRSALGPLLPNGTEAAYVVAGFDGRVIAMIGQRDYARTQMNLAVDTNSQAASTFKPFSYAAAIENGAIVPSGDHTDALARSDNAAAIRVARLVGYEEIKNLAHRMGVTSPIRVDKGLPLGVSEVGLLEQTMAYVPFAHGGMGAKPFGYLGVVSNGEVLAWTMPSTWRALPEKVADTMRGMLRAVVSDGTGRPASSIKGAGGKTGTSDRNRDAWFIGFTSRHVSGLWIGRPDDAPMASISGTTAAAAWAKIEKVLPNE